MKIIIAIALLLAIASAHSLSSHSKLKNKSAFKDEKKKDDNIFTHEKKPHGSGHSSLISLEEPDSNIKLPTLAQAKYEYENKGTSTSEYYNIPGWWGSVWIHDYDPLCHWISDSQLEGLTMSCHCFGAWDIGGDMDAARNQCMIENCFMFTGKLMECYECMGNMESQINGVSTTGVMSARPEYQYLADCDIAALILEDMDLGEQYGYKPIWDYNWH